MKTKKYIKKKPANHKAWIFMRTKAGQEEKFFWDEILYLEADGDFTWIVTTKGRYYKAGGIGKQIKKLDHPTLFRCHRSYAVNISCVELLHYDCVVIKGIEIQVARKYQYELSQKLHQGQILNGWL